MSKFIDLTNQKFDRLTVIKRVENNKQGQSQFLCQCDCEGENSLKVIRGYCLKNGHTKSCGCLTKEKIIEANKKYNKYNLSGEYGVGYTSNTNEEFYFDLEDYGLIKDYCWMKNDNGYIVSTKNRKKNILMHRLVMHCPDDMEIDHKFHNLYDNRKEFLRIVTKSKNAMNRVLSPFNTSGVTGVHLDKRNNKWISQIKVNGESIHLGCFDNFEEAVEIRKRAEIDYFGEYRYIN